MDIGRFQYIQGTGERQHLALDLAWDSFNFVECLLVYQERHAAFSVSWTRSSEVCHMLQYFLYHGGGERSKAIASVTNNLLPG